MVRFFASELKEGIPVTAPLILPLMLEYCVTRRTRGELFALLASHHGTCFLPTPQPAIAGNGGNLLYLSATGEVYRRADQWERVDLPPFPPAANRNRR